MMRGGGEPVDVFGSGFFGGAAASGGALCRWGAQEPLPALRVGSDASLRCPAPRSPLPAGSGVCCPPCC
jgi:hypothetical protein